MSGAGKNLGSSDLTSMLMGDALTFLSNNSYAGLISDAVPIVTRIIGRVLQKNGLPAPAPAPAPTPDSSPSIRPGGQTSTIQGNAIGVSQTFTITITVTPGSSTVTPGSSSSQTQSSIQGQIRTRSPNSGPPKPIRARSPTPICPRWGDFAAPQVRQAFKGKTRINLKPFIRWGSALPVRTPPRRWRISSGLGEGRRVGYHSPLTIAMACRQWARSIMTGLWNRRTNDLRSAGGQRPSAPVHIRWLFRQAQSRAVFPGFLQFRELRRSIPSRTAG